MFPFTVARRFAAACLLLASCLGAAHASPPSCRAATPAEAIAWGGALQHPGVVSPVDGTCWLTGFTIAGADGVTLTANVFLPRGAGEPGRTFPTVVFISSWATADFFEYIGQQQRLARDGYIALAYTARGFYLSQGIVGVAGPQDVADVSSVVSWAIENTPADPRAIGASGISYGAGLALLALGADPRLKTATALSGWGTLLDEMYAQDVGNRVWIDVLLLSGAVTGRLDPFVFEAANAVLNPDTPAAKIEALRAWGAVRSPSSAVDAINRRAAPVFISKNLQDDMFTPNSSLQMFARLVGPKKLLLNPGIHAGAELGAAITGADNYPMDQAHRWLDRWLKNRPNGIDTEPQVDLQVKFTNRRETLSTWPAPELRTETYHLTPRGALGWDLFCLCWRGVAGGLAAAPNTRSGGDTIDSVIDTTATSGPVPILSTLGEGFGAPVLNFLATIFPANGVRYEAPARATPLQIRGVAKLHLRATPSQRRGMLVAYLYDADPLGFATLITHGARALHAAAPQVPIDLPIDLAATAYDVPAGHHLALVLDTADPLYAPPVNIGETFRMRLDFAAGLASTLSVPAR